MEITATESHQVLSRLLDLATDPLFLLDTDWKFLWVNRRAAQLFARTRDELRERTLWECWPQSVGTEFQARLQRALADHESVHFLFSPAIDANRSVEVSVYPTSEGMLVGLKETLSGNGLGDRSTGHPPETQGRSAEQSLPQQTETQSPQHESPPEFFEPQPALEERVAERTAHLQETISALESLCYNIAHDLRAPLRAMQGMSNALLEEYGASLDDTGREYAERIVTSASRMDRLIQDLLAYGRLSQLDLQCGNTDLETPVASVLSKLHQQITARYAHIEVQTPMPRVWANPTLLEHILINLLSNALKFAKPGVNPHIRILAEEKAPAVRLWVEDDGIGIDQAHHQKIFHIFERLNSDGSIPGTGMGLAIVKKAAERLGGRAGVESIPGEGSRFWVDLQPTKSDDVM